MANCRACTAPLPEGVQACPACDEPVPGAPRKREEREDEKAPGDAEGRVSAANSETIRPDATPSNEAMLALTAGIAACAFGFLPCLVSWFFLYLPAFGATLGIAGFAVWRGTTELQAIDAKTSPEAGRKPANLGRILGFAGGALGFLTLVLRVAVNVLRHR